MADEPTQRSFEAAIFQTWLRIQEHEAEHPGEPYATVLHLRQSRPKVSIAELAQEFSDMAGSPVSPAAFRKILHHARRRFLELFNESGHGRP